jgi:protein-S-isoprenylcysteine O-methyltransferase Ste14
MSLVPAFEIGVWNGWLFMMWLVIQNIAIWLVNKEAYQRGSDPADMKRSNKHKIAGYISLPLWLLTTVYSIFLPFKLGTIWFYIGLPVFLLGLIMTIATTVNFTNTPINKPIIKGIYRCSRHPMYVAMFLIYLSVGIASASWVFLLVSVLWLTLINPAAADEEHYCLEKYGAAYSEYMDKTPRWIGIPKSG